jgi:hypothetical protein
MIITIISGFFCRFKESKAMSETLTPPQLARRWSVDPEKILRLIRTGQLEAVNLATDPKGRPRYRISPEAIERFVASRTTKPPAPRQRRRRRRELAGASKSYF